MKKKLLIIYNPTAGQRNKRFYNKVLFHFNKNNLKYDIERTKFKGDAYKYAQNYNSKKYKHLIVAGGDGTINEVINGLKAENVIIGIIPLGTANVFAAEIGLKNTSFEIAQNIINGYNKKVFIGRINEKRFVQMVGIGFDAHIVNKVNLKLKKTLGKFAYVYQTLVHLIKFKNNSYTIIIRDKSYKASSIVISNGHFYGGRYFCSPAASPFNKKLYVCLFLGNGRSSYIKYSLALILGIIPKLKDIKIIEANDVYITQNKKEPVQGDGEIITNLPAKVSIAKFKLNFIVNNLSAK